MPLLNWRRLLGFTPIKDATGLGPDFPGSAGDRERGKFRESEYPRLTTIAVTDDEGRPLGRTTDQIMEELLYEMRLLRTGLVVSGMATDMEEEIQT